MANAAAIASAQVALDLWTEFMLNPFPLPMTAQETIDYAAGGANPIAEYVADPLLMQAAVELVVLLFAQTHGNGGNQDEARINTFDVTDINTFLPNGEVANLNHHGLFMRMCTINIPVAALQTGANFGGRIPIDLPADAGTLVGSGFSRAVSQRVDHLAGGQLGGPLYRRFYNAIRRVRPNFFDQHPEVIAHNIAQANLQNANAAALNAAAAAAAAAANPPPPPQPNPLPNPLPQGAAALAPNALPVPGPVPPGGPAAVGGVPIPPGGFAGAVPVGAAIGAMGMAAGGGGVNNFSFFRMLENTPKLIPVQGSDEIDRITKADVSYNQLQTWLRLRLPLASFDQLIQAHQNAVSDPSAQSNLIQSSQARRNNGIADRDILRMLMMEIRAYMARLLETRVRHLDKGYFNRINIIQDSTYTENLRMAVRRIEDHHTMLSFIYTPAELQAIYGTAANFQDAAAPPMVSAMEQANPTYGQWVRNQPNRQAITWAQIQAYANSEPLLTSTPTQVTTPGSAAPSSEEQPIYQTRGEGGDDGSIGNAGPIATEVITHITAPINSIRDEVRVVAKTVERQGEAIAQLQVENKTLRTGLNNRNTYGDDAFSSSSSMAAQTSSQTDASKGKLNMAQIAVAMQAGSGGGRTTEKSGSARTKITLDMLREKPGNKPWVELIERLLRMYGRTMKDPCVVCMRGDGKIPPMRQHPTEECGLLFTLLKIGEDWLMSKSQNLKAVKRSKDGSAQQKQAMVNLAASWAKQMDASAEAAGYSSESIQASICQLCGDEPDATEQYIQACESNWENCEAVIANLGEQLSK